MENPKEFPQSNLEYANRLNVYYVDARWLGDDPIEIGGMLFYENWKRIRPTASGLLIPIRNQNIGKYISASLGLLNYSAAEALRWNFCIECERKSEDKYDFPLQTRIVKTKIEFSVSETSISSHKLIDHGFNRKP